MSNSRYIITDFDGTFTNTHDVVSAPVKSQDSPVIVKEIRAKGVQGVYGCTHRNTDGYSGFVEKLSWGEFGDENEVPKQKLAAITERLSLVCEAANVPFFGVSTEYDLNGLFSGYHYVIEAEDALNSNPMLYDKFKLPQEEKNAQIQQIIDDIETKESGHSNLIIIDFYDDKLQILKALERAHLRMPPNMELRLWNYKFSINDEPLTQVAIIKMAREAAPVLSQLAFESSSLDAPLTVAEIPTKPSNNRFFSTRNKVLIAGAVALSAGAIPVGVLVGVTTPLFMGLCAAIALALLALLVLAVKNHFVSQLQSKASPMP